MADRRASIATFASRAEDGRFPRCLFVDAREAKGGVGVDEFWMRRCTTLMYTLWIVIGRLFSIYHKKLSCVLSVLSFPVHFVICEPKHLSHSDFRKMLDYHNGTSKHKVETEGRRVEDSKSLNLKNRCYNSGDPASPDLFPISTIHQGWFRPLPDFVGSRDSRFFNLGAFQMNLSHQIDFSTHPKWPFLNERMSFWPSHGWTWVKNNGLSPKNEPPQNHHVRPSQAAMAQLSFILWILIIIM